jgi:pimeloyl-ACP methyl ester carboxylesterase
MNSSHKSKITFKHKDGEVDGIYLNAGTLLPLVIIVNGHNGFYNYGMFPYIQQSLYENGISSYSFNFSHGGIKGDEDYFGDLEKYEKNCIRLETEDLLCVLQNLNSGEFSKPSKVILLAHSLGGVPAIFGTKYAEEQHINIAGIILVSTVKTLNFWPAAMIQEWATAGVFYKKNNRTNQELPQGFEFLQEILKCDTNWNVEAAIKSLKHPAVLIIHGEKDEAIPIEHAYTLFEWLKQTKLKSQFTIIKNATHTFNTVHPFKGPSNELDKLIETTITWIKQ